MKRSLASLVLDLRRARTGVLDVAYDSFAEKRGGGDA
jgi:hypothetical protein